MSTLRSQRIAFANHSKHIAVHQVRGDPRQLDEDRVTLAYGHGAIPKLVEQLKSPLLEVCLKALFSLSSLLSTPENKIKALKAGAVPTLLTLLQDPEAAVRESSLVALGLIAVCAKGRDEFHSVKAVGQIMPLFDDAETNVRRNAYLTLYHQSSTPMGAKALLEADCVPILIRNSNEENPDDVRVLILATLHNCLQVEQAVDQALEYPVLRVLREVIQGTEHEEIKERAIGCVAALSFELSTKALAMKEGLIPILIELLAHESGALRDLSAAALMSITIDDHAKVVAFDGGMVDLVAPLLADSFETVQLNATKCISSMAHHVKARARFKELQVEKAMQEFLEHENPLLRRNAKVALNVLAGER